ncbi:hypothetical protein [Spirillospora sp. NPDC048819]|uniref:hypothetical protein n=1 Tax=Spirillospora sp. NPDC048819 TaxID=3155268 RepID=UPI0033CF777F
MDDWQRHAWALAETVTHPVSQWRPIVAEIPRHVFIPRWFAAGDGWVAADGLADPQAWARVAYRDRTVVTRIGADHADEAEPGIAVRGRPMSSATTRSPNRAASRAAPYPKPLPASRMSRPSPSIACRYNWSSRPGKVPDEFDRIVGTFSVPHVPASSGTPPTPDA